MNTTLLNFRAPDEIKDDFMKVCQLNCTTMTSEFVKFMLEFISEGNERIQNYKVESNNLNNKSVDPVIERHGHLIKDPSTSTWITADEWNNNCGL